VTEPEPRKRSITSIRIRGLAERDERILAAAEKIAAERAAGDKPS
jgi:hypothetical protein